MSRLINPGLGDVVDRLSILSLKLLHGAFAGKDLSHWKNERNVLLAQVSARTLNGSWFSHALDLAAVNSALWHAEDELRELRGDGENDPAVQPVTFIEAGRIGFNIQALNDQRAQLVGAINQLAGDERGSEK